jgi:hypothetical protein
LRGGVPSLRHDWIWPLDNGGLFQYFSQLGFGWSTDGLGHANPYPMTYFVIAPLAGITAFAGSRVSLVVLLLTVAVALGLAAFRIARAFGLGRVEVCALTLFLTFNSFTHTKLIAGHLTQTMALAGVAIFWAELLAKQPSRRYLIAGAVLCALQTQFFLLMLVAGLVFVRRRDVAAALAISTAVFLPTIVGIVLNLHTLLGWPMTVAWENDQSVPLLSGVLLSGFFAHYDVGFGNVAMPAEAIYLGLSLLALLAIRQRSITASALVVVLALLIASGTKGPLQWLWVFAIQHVPEVGVYRELYDLIGIVAVGYTVLVAAVLARFPRLRWAAAGASLLLVCAWIYSPPDRFWVDAATLPPAPKLLDDVARFALMPAFQPFSFGGRGSGADPLAAGMSPSHVSLNATQTEYPADIALATFAQSGDTAPLARLGVGVIACRPGFQQSEGSRAFYGQVAARCPLVPRLISANPLVSLEVGEPGTCSLCRSAGAGNVLIGDASVGWWRGLPDQRVDVDPARGWIDARLQFAQRPALGQPFGGAYSEQNRSTLPLPQGPYVLANIRGRLLDGNGRVLWRGTGAYQWYKRDASVTAVRCEGQCLVAAVGDPAQAPLEVQPKQAEAIPTRTLFPWLLVATAPPNARGVARFLETYDPSWAAFTLRGIPLAHVRLDGVINGWRFDGAGGPIVLVEVTAALQFVAAIFGISVLLFVAARGVGRFKGTS